jgi:hypothetical protein
MAALAPSTDVTQVVTAPGQPSRTQSQINVIITTPRSTVAGVTPSVVVITQIVTPSSSGFLPRLTTAYTQAPECATRWVLLSTAGSVSITSGNFANDLVQDGIGSSYWRPCYASVPTPAYSPGVCYSGLTPAIIQQALIQVASNDVPQKRWQALCCPRYGDRRAPQAK